MECTWDAALLRRGEQLPPELLQIIQNAEPRQYLQAITQATHDPRCTYILFAHSENLFGHICATLRSEGSLASSIATLGRIVPFAPYLVPYAERLLATEHYVFSTSNTSDEDLLYLLGLFRLLAFKWRTFKKHVKPDQISVLLESLSRPIVYLAIRILQIYLSAADHWFEGMMRQYLGEDTPESDIDGIWDDKIVDYRFLTLWEEERFEKVLKLVEDVRSQAPSNAAHQNRVIPVDCFDASTTLVGGLLLPKLSAQHASPSSNVEQLVVSDTVARNLQSVASALKSSQPILLKGLPGSGKTATVRHVAHGLGALDKMVTLHLNEQSDAKLLIGIHTTGETPGSFVWKPGVLTTAVREGRWILIEDLDRAPNEIISTLLPLIEKRELLIPNRKQTIHAAQGFRIIATVRSTTDYRGQETNPLTHMLGARHWQRVSVEMPSLVEWHEIAKELFRSLERLLPQFMAVYESIQTSRQRAVLTQQSRTGILRPVTPRDFLKWCRRVTELHQAQPPRTAAFDDVFLEAIDCFVGALPDCAARASMVAGIAENLQIDPDRRDFLLASRTIRYEADKSKIAVGRYTFPRAAFSKKSSAKATFSTDNPHTKRMLERVAAASTTNREPLLLVGETGVGKTAAVQHLASALGRNLVAFNLSQQSEAGDLLGGFKPVSARSLIIPLKDEFDDLFSASFAASKNQQFQERLGKHIVKEDWRSVCKFWRAALEMVEKQREPNGSSRQGEAPSKKRKVELKVIDFARWDAFATKVSDMEKRLAAGPEAFAFRFVEGSIVKAVRNGDWVLLDEINLASTDTLESIADLFDSRAPSLLLAEAGDIERVDAHPDFRIFAAMNPATDVGKRDLPPSIRSRFTELYVESPDKDNKSLQSIIRTCLGHAVSSDQAVALDTSMLYQKIIELVESNKLVDGAGQRPHFSLRTLTRTLSFTKYIAPLCNLRRALYEGFQMSFMTLLDAESSAIIQPLLERHLFGKHTNLRAELQKALRRPSDGHRYVQGFPGSKHWARQGELEVEDQSQYILTPFIRTNLENLIRATSTRQFPVLIQGPTSSGKTSMIEYLAKRTGHKFVRINNHEHTDLQEYMGTYISDADGRLRFQEGLLVKAIRKGHWIVLDELNLAPSDVLEALNRLLDDNRELLIPETQEIVHPHANFMLFATQNPAGLYGGRKTLSRAFRNRFLELHFDDIPIDELQEILHRRTELPESRCKRIVNVYRKLSILRQQNRLFEQKSFATLRDLFRWALRPNDTIEDLAANGFMLLAERVRKPEERQTLRGVMEEEMSRNGLRVRINESALYAQDCNEINHYQRERNDSIVVWTKAMRRLYVLVSRAIRNNEPVLLVGDTGCGKTTVCQMLADAYQRELRTVNAHQNTETGDLIGSQRPVRNRAVIEADLRHQLLSSRLLQDIETAPSYSTDTLLELYDRALASLSHTEQDAHRQSPEYMHLRASRTRVKTLFEWNDGALVQAMKNGDFFLLDEISLADDSVLERINSVLEPGRSILLAEKGSLDSYVKAAPDFQIFATMNPGGDYGKRELSPALRNRFTKIWVPPLDNVDDIKQVVNAKLVEEAEGYTGAMVEFAHWFNERYNTSASSSVSIRDALAWVIFINAFAEYNLLSAIIHGAAMVYIDTLGANPAGLLTMARSSLDEQRAVCLDKLSELLGSDANAVYSAPIDITLMDDQFVAGPFSTPRHSFTSIEHAKFSFQPRTTKTNTMRVIRALQLSKPIMLEGNPGVGKTALITAIAEAVGMPLTRINLSEQTDLIDLFGSDVPIEGEAAGTFAWRDAPFLRAMQRGEWVLLDEMNLASQSILEGLNACLDHRGEVFVPELGQTFRRHPQFRLFAAQNPHHQGGGRKGLPASFVNRFTVVFADAFRSDDLVHLCTGTFPHIDRDFIQAAVQFVESLDSELERNPQFGISGRPWEFNLRDLQRWLPLASANEGLLQSATPRDLVDFLFTQRFRSDPDRAFVRKLFSHCFQDTHHASDLFASISSRAFQLGLAILSRNSDVAMSRDLAPRPLLSGYISPEILQSAMLCIQQRWPVILSGFSGSGKTMLVDHLAAMVGASVTTITLNADTDIIDLLGGYEQADPRRRADILLQNLLRQYDSQARASFGTRNHVQAMRTLSNLMIPEFDLDRPEHNDNLVQLFKSINSAEAQAVLHEIQLATTADKGRFEWVDGLLIESLKEGRWLVLDNANLCSPSVLDRLNSLLEPAGVLLVNEHGNPDGTPRIVQPHPNFRIFLNLDPRYGELSRAMRNRAVELHLPETSEAPSRSCNGWLHSESAIARFPLLKEISVLTDRVKSPGDLLQVASDHLGIQDAHLLSRFERQLHFGLYPQFKLFGHLDSTESGLSYSKTEGLHEYYTACTSRMQVPADFVNVQTFHPLNNQALVHTSQQAFITALSLATAQDATIELAPLTDFLQHAQSDSGLLSNLRRIERAIGIQPPSKAQTQQSLVISLIKAFTNGVLQALKTLPKDDLPALYKTRKIIGEISSFCTVAARMLKNKTADAPHLLAFLTALNHYIDSRRNESPAILGPRLEEVHQTMMSFLSAAKTARGRACVEIWKSLKPRSATTHAQLEDLLRFETVLDRFNRASLTLSTTLESTVTLRLSIVRNLALAVDHGEELTSLSDKFESLLPGHDISDETATLQPHFHEIFCRLHERLSVLMLSGTDTLPGEHLATLALLATRGVKDGIDYHAAFGLESTRRQFLLLGSTIGTTIESNTQVVSSQNILAGLLQQGTSAAQVSLRQVKLLETELESLGNLVASRGHLLATHEVGLLEVILASLVSRVLAAIGTSTDDEPIQALASHLLLLLDSRNRGADFEDPAAALSHLSLSPDSNETDLFTKLSSIVLNLRGTYTDHRKASIRVAEAWTTFALVCLHLYVPQVALDPAIEPKLRHAVWMRHRDGIDARLQTTKAFREALTGQAICVRTRVLEQDLHNLDPAPSYEAIYRPEISQLPELNQELEGLMRTLEPLWNGVGDCKNGILAEHTLANILSVRKRLTEEYRAYEDFTFPIIGFIDCLLVGDRLVQQSTEASSWSSSNRLSALIPFSGATFGTWLSDEFFYSIQSSTLSTDQRLLWLNALAVRSAIWPLAESSNFLRAAVHEQLYRFYASWKDRLGEEQQKLAAKSSLYKYKGEVDDQDPSQDEADEYFAKRETKPTAKQHESLAHIISTLHSSLYLPHQIDPTRITELLDQLTTMDLSNVDELQAIPVAIRSLGARHDSLHIDTKETQSYDIYKDANIQESQQLLGLLHKANEHFRWLHRAWPEHAIPMDVQILCEDILTLSHTLPLMQFLPRLEKLHSTMNEWQKVTSREYSALEVFEELTSLIVRWRQLELSTWASLLDHERQQCDRDTTSWWYIAYESIIEVTRKISAHPQGMRSHLVDLLATLGGFLSSCGLGEYSARLRMLKGFEAHLAVNAVDDPQMAIVRIGLSNLISYYAKFEPAATESLSQGRSELEREIRNVIQLASWKDRNIDILRQSAASSHKKLLRLVRKYRNLLAQPMSSIMQGEFPLRVDQSLAHPSDLALSAGHSHSEEKIHLGLWDDRPTRVRDAASTSIAIRAKIDEAHHGLDGAVKLEVYSKGLAQSISELQKATPAILTEDNKALVNHLKTRKRRLLADVLKDLRQMGLRTSISQQMLDRQSSLHLVLAHHPNLKKTSDQEDMASIEYNFHRFLNLIIKTRDATRTPSEDLTTAEVQRCTSLLESLLQTNLDQYKSLSHQLEKAEKLQRVVLQLQNLTRCDRYSAASSSDDVFNGMTEQLACVVPMLKVCADTIRVQQRLSSIDYSEVVNLLESKAAELGALQSRVKDAPVLPSGLVSPDHKAMQMAIFDKFEEFCAALQDAITSHPELGPVLSQLCYWIKRDDRTTLSPSANGHAPLTLHAWTTEMLAIVDTILHSVEDVHKHDPKTSVKSNSNAWLIEQQGKLHTMFEVLHAEEIAQKLSNLLSQIQHLNHLSSTSNASVLAICRSLRPIFNAYQIAIQAMIAASSKLCIQTSQLGYNLSKSFIQLVSQGFCSPSEKTLDSKQNGSLESGTGLGDGSGAEDISKDIGDDEDLSEMAQEKKSKEDSQELEDEKDAVDMADEEMEADVGDISNGSEDDDNTADQDGDEGNDLPEEVGNADAQDSNHVDEKMWDGDADEHEADKEANSGRGTADKKDMTAPKDADRSQADQGEGDEDIDDNDESGVSTEDVERTSLEMLDPNAAQEENLDLPDDIDMEKQELEESEGSDIASLDQDTGEEAQVDAASPTAEDTTLEDATKPDLSDDDAVRSDMRAGQDEQVQEDDRVEENSSDLLMQESAHHPNDSAMNDVPLSLNGSGPEPDEGASSGRRHMQEPQLDMDRDNRDSSDQLENDTNGTGRDERGVTGNTHEDRSNTEAKSAFKQLYDASQHWYDQHRPIQENRSVEDEKASDGQDVDMAEAQFEHLPNAEADHDTQALGTASAEQSSALQHDNSIPIDDSTEQSEQEPMEERQQQQSTAEDPQPVADLGIDLENDLGRSKQTRSFVGESHPMNGDTEMVDDIQSESSDDEDKLDEPDARSDAPGQVPYSEMQAAWSHHEENTRNLAVILTEHLRLILQPTKATKLRGDFRTGKRLNIKRIISYIASSYKRDKIWMRRSVPSKRSYQIMLAIDDSQSMTENNSRDMAFDTLALVARSMSMLEVGELSVVGFGQDVKVAHDFSNHFSADAGAQILQQFTFSQNKTNVRKLLMESIELFRAARLKATGAASDLWQLQLIISDGICEDHSSIRQLVRQAHEERIMIVFIIIDSPIKHPASASESKHSITNQPTAEFVKDESGEMQLKMGQYLDTFPFWYYLIVQNIEELPEVLAGALRQWFAEVVDVSP